jgi:hypothetical protein
MVTAKRRSARLAGRLGGSADPAIRAHDMKLKKLGLISQADDAKINKK